MKVVFRLFLLGVLASVYSCSSDSAEVIGEKSNSGDSLAVINADEQIINSDLERKVYTVDTFSVIPDELEGGACYFFLSKSDMETEKYIYVGDFGSSAYLMLNNSIEKFNLVSSKEDLFEYSNSALKLRVDILSREESDDLKLLKGTLIVSQNSDTVYRANIIGYCGE